MLLTGLADSGFGPEQLGEMQRLINAEKSDIFDVLAYVAYALAPLTRAERAVAAQQRLRTRFSTKEQAFIGFARAEVYRRLLAEADAGRPVQRQSDDASAPTLGDYF